MRLLQRLSCDDFDLTSFDEDITPPYAILSHTWAEGQEVTYQELAAGVGKDKTGCDKIRFCAERAAVDGLQYFWIDTCCIDKSNNNELSTAINSMFRWYQRASKCYVYLHDVSMPDVLDAQASRLAWLERFQRSRWFTRGWTLQELVAPAVVEFFSKEGQLLGNRISLEQDIHRATKIPIEVLRGESPSNFSVRDRMSWAASRTTTIKEDKAYCLLGIFGVFLPLIYGEGEAHANLRLMEEIRKRHPEKSVGQTSNNINSVATGSLLRSSCVIPFRRDPDFIHRGLLLDEIRKKSSAPASRVALVGLGGVGKSQLAIEYCYQIAENSPETWVFWVHASSAARIEQGYHSIADQVKLDRRSDPHTDIFQLVHDWLRDVKNGKWLLVLDNVDDANALSLPAAGGGARSLPRSFSSYLPQSQHSAVVVTSRTKIAALQLVEEDDILDVEPMDDSAAQSLLQKKLGKEADETHIAELAKALEFMPLALAQAAALIRRRAPRYSVQRYLADFHKSDRKKTSLLDYDGGRLRRDVEAKNAILLTWHISFDHIRHIRRSAADLLSFMSFFDRQGIPEELIRGSGWVEKEYYSAKTVTSYDGGNRRVASDSESDSSVDESEASIDDGFEEDIAMLRSYSMIALSTDGTKFDMHRLVQLATRSWLEEQGQLETWKHRHIDRLSVTFPRGEYENWARCEALFPHAKAALSQPPKSEVYRAQWATLSHHVAWYAWKKQSLSDAEKFCVSSMKIRQELFGRDGFYTTASMSMLGQILDLSGRWVEAEELGVEVMGRWKVMFGDEHPATLTSMCNLATTYKHRGQLMKAEELHLQALQMRRRVLGDTHQDTRTSLSCLATVYCNQGRLKEAEELELQVLETDQIVHGHEHPHTLIGMGNLAITYRCQGRLEEAEELELQTLEISKRVLGDEHLDTLRCMGELAFTYNQQGRLKEAEQLNLRVLEVRKRKLGDENGSTLTSMNNLAIVLKDQGRIDEALSLIETVVRIGKRVYGPQHPNTLGSSAMLVEWRQARM